MKTRDRFFSEIQLSQVSKDKYRLTEDLPSKRRAGLIVQEGHLRMQRRSLRKTNPQTWKEMYMVLNESHLYCYTTKDDQIPKQMILLDESVGIYPADVKDKQKNYCIKISTKASNYSICAESEHERDIWLTMLLTVISEKLLTRSASRQNVSRYSMA